MAPLVIRRYTVTCSQRGVRGGQKGGQRAAGDQAVHCVTCKHASATYAGAYGMVWDGMGWYGMVWDGTSLDQPIKVGGFLSEG
eukprot:1864469-Pyramimonas_sp.AAC.1